MADPTALIDALRYALSVLRETEQVMDHTTVEWAEVATAVHYISHIVDGRAGDLARAAVVEHERYLARHPEPDAPRAASQTDEPRSP